MQINFVFGWQHTKWHHTYICIIQLSLFSWDSTGRLGLIHSGLCPPLDIRQVQRDVVLRQRGLSVQRPTGQEETGVPCSGLQVSSTSLLWPITTYFFSAMIPVPSPAPPRQIIIIQIVHLAPALKGRFTPMTGSPPAGTIRRPSLKSPPTPRSSTTNSRWLRT